ncbi:MAG: hypothetical protein CMH27_10545 [Micavibrio sp.]|nr:hypothetical protein [Micavibrio sp.]|tara:strand:- start:307 stop:2622 length:2316 start_codon:yes stop_codon:yes gene_type:complete
MSDSTGTTKLPDISHSPSALSSAKGKSPLNAKLIGVPNVTEGRNDRVVRLKGEITQKTDHGRVRIQTQSGEIEVQIPENESQAASKLTKGQRVEIDIPPEKVRNRTDNTIHIRPDTRSAASSAAPTESSPQKQQEQKSQATPEPRNTVKIPDRSIEIKTQPYVPPATGTKTAQNTQGVEQRAITNAQGVKADMQALLSKTTLQFSDAQQLQGIPLRLDPLPKDMLAQITVSQQHSIRASVTSIANFAQSLPLTINSQTSLNLTQSATEASNMANTTSPTIHSALFPQNATTNIVQSTVNNTLNQGVKSNQLMQNITLIQPASPQTTEASNLISPTISFTFNFKPQHTDIVKHLSPHAITLTGAAQTSNVVNDPLQSPVNQQVISTTLLGPEALTVAINTLTLPPVKIEAPSISTTANTDEISLKDFLMAQAKEMQASSAPLATIAQPENSENLKIMTAHTQNSQNPPLLTQSQIGSITATFSGYTPQNLPVLSVFLPDAQAPKNFILQLPLQNISTGTQIEMTLHSPGVNSQSASATTHTLPLPSSLITPGTWPTLQDITQTLESLAASNSITANASPGILPSPSSPGQMGPAILFIFAALKSGDLTQILNDKALDQLKRAGKGGLISRLNGEGHIINRSHVDSTGQDWRALTIPMQWQNDVHKIALFYKQHENDDGEDGKGGGKHTRFIFDLALTNMGKVQLDGLHRNDRLDLIIRTEDPFSRSMQFQMKAAYTDALETSNLNGDLSFQNDPQNWINIEVKDNEKFKVHI